MHVADVDPVERLSDGRRRRRRLLSCVERHDINHERRGRQPVDASARPDHSPQRPRHQEPLRDPLGPREHQPLHAGPTNTRQIITKNYSHRVSLFV